MRSNNIIGKTQIDSHPVATEKISPGGASSAQTRSVKTQFRTSIALLTWCPLFAATFQIAYLHLRLMIYMLVNFLDQDELVAICFQADDRIRRRTTPCLAMNSNWRHSAKLVCMLMQRRRRRSARRKARRVRSTGRLDTPPVVTSRRADSEPVDPARPPRAPTGGARRPPAPRSRRAPSAGRTPASRRGWTSGPRPGSPLRRVLLAAPDAASWRTTPPTRLGAQVNYFALSVSARSTAMSVSVCLSVCLSVCSLAYLKNHSCKLHEIFCTHATCGREALWTFRRSPRWAPE